MSKNIRAFAAAVTVAAASALPVPALAQQDDAEKQFGIVHFETSCNETAQRRFLREGNLDLALPLRWAVYGDAYAILR